MKLSKDLKELDFKRNLEFRLQLLSKIESLLQIESIRGMERMIKLYRMEWSEMGPTAPEKTDELRSRYRELIGEVYQKIREYYKERQKEEQVNLAAKKTLLERVQKISEEKFDTPKQWQTMTETLQKILEEWKQIGFAPKAENEKVWEGFRNALKLFYTNKRAYFGELKNFTREIVKKRCRFLRRRMKWLQRNRKTGTKRQNRFCNCKKSGKNRDTLTHGMKINFGKNSGKHATGSLNPSAVSLTNGMRTR